VTTVLLVEDDLALLRTLSMNLEARGYAVSTAPDGESALAVLRRTQPDLVILDLGLPGVSGSAALRELRTWSAVPVIVLSARHGSDDKVEALDLGADDYVTKPFGIDELLARVRAVTRRTNQHDAEPATVPLGDHVIDLANKTISGGVRLTPTEWHFLEILLRNPGKLISQRQLLTEVWGGTYLKETHYLRQYMAQLRRKLERDPAHPVHLLTEPGMGYRFQPS
jgi:two-component system, OmpR family, KDP operon response regulator KdpE